MKIGILNPYHFPEGLAATTRIISYSKALLLQDVKCEIFSFAWKIDTDLSGGEGIVEGIPFKYGHVTPPTRNKLYKVIIDKRKNFTGTIKNIEESHKKERFDFIILSFDAVPLFKYFCPKLKRMGIKMIFIADEFPEPIRHLKEKVPEKDIAAYSKILNDIYGRIFMTESIRNFYDEINYSKNTLIFNSIVDVHRFDGLKKEKVCQPYLCYMGNLQLAKDNVDNIIRAFKILSPKFPNLILRLYGCPNPADLKIIEDLIAELNLNDKVKIMGRINYKEVPRVLYNAEILVTSQPQTKRAQGGFPTKMAEYMMTGNPTILTDVGEIHKYIKDGENAFMVEPCNPQKYAEKLEFILNNPQFSSRVAKEGKKYIINNFSVESAGKLLKSFFQSLTSN